MRGYIYVVTNTTNNKKYIGQTTKDLHLRQRQHILTSKRNAISPFHKALLFYGDKYFIWEILETIESDNKKNLISVLNEREIENIKIYDTFYGYGYNCDIGGSGHVGYKHTPETKEKMSNAAKGKIFSDERKSRMSESAKNKNFSESHRKNLSISMTTRMLDPNKNPMYGKKGELAHQSKLKSEEVLKIRELYSKEGYSYKDISIMFNVSRGNIANIVKRKSWNHI
jgi:group I intron endonuclease